MSQPGILRPLSPDQSDGGDDTNLQKHSPNVLRRFYEPLLLLHILDSIRGDRIKAGIPSDQPGRGVLQSRRNFVDAIAYICAYKKDPNYVTAAAIEKTSQSILVWLAANSSVEPRVTNFLQGVLNSLQGLMGLDDSNITASKENVLSSITDEILLFNTPRNKIYYSEIYKKCLPSCTKVMSQACSENSNPLITEFWNWHHEHFSHDPNEITPLQLAGVAKACHRARKFDVLIPFMRQGQERFQDFERLFKLLNKLGKHITISRKLVEAALSLPQDFGQDFIVKSIKSSKPRGIPLIKGKSTVSSIAGRMFSSTTDKENFIERVSQAFELNELSQALEAEYTQKKTRVHCELLLIDHFEKNGGDFLDNHDKYIGCSKPACYLCYLYIRNHRGRYSLPASHQKLYVSWRVPDIVLNERHSNVRCQQQRKILQSLTEQVRKDLVSDLTERTNRRPFHADSTMGITSTIESSVASSVIEPLYRISRHGSVRSYERINLSLGTEDTPGKSIVAHESEPVIFTRICDAADQLDEDIEEGGVPI